MRITVDVPDAEVKRLEEAARRLHVAPEVLAAAAVHDMVTHDDAEFAGIVKRIMEKNKELYRRLA
jgi:predicted transcriptional regulator